MSAAAIFDPIADLLDLDTVERCRFCGCTEDAPCRISIAQDDDGTVRLARTPQETADEVPCGWYLPGVCNAPQCLEGLIAEWRSVRLFGADGRRLA
jgi:hypothetical protein